MNIDRTLKITTPSEREVAWTRTFDAPRLLVFRALTEPDLIRQWLLGPDGWSMPICEVDLRVGGAYRYVWQHPEKGSMTIRGAFREVTPPERIVHTETFDDPWFPGEAIVTAVLTEADGSTTLSMNMLMESPEGQAAVLRSGMEHGLEPSYQRLAEVVANLS